MNELVYVIQLKNNSTRWVPGRIERKIGKTIYQIIINHKKNETR